MIKAGYENYMRYLSDTKENMKECNVLDINSENEKTRPVKWKDLEVGQIIRIQEDEFLPADVMILSTSDKKTGKCFIETKNLDGETNLK